MVYQIFQGIFLFADIQQAEMSCMEMCQAIECWKSLNISERSWPFTDCKILPRKNPPFIFTFVRCVFSFSREKSIFLESGQNSITHSTFLCIVLEHTIQWAQKINCINKQMKVSCMQSVIYRFQVWNSKHHESKLRINDRLSKYINKYGRQKLWIANFILFEKFVCNPCDMCGKTNGAVSELESLANFWLAVNR